MGGVDKKVVRRMWLFGHGESVIKFVGGWWSVECGRSFGSKEDVFLGWLGGGWETL